MRQYFIILAIFIANIIYGQERAWPTSTGKQLTSNFGEFRDRHFHMGLDIRTHSSVGHPLYAINDGYIFRIATNFGGYGNAIYLKTNDNKIALYGHLNHFTKNIEHHLSALRNEKRSFSINKYFTPDEYPVKQGQIIGYSGNSGGSMGPHLHFELRNENDQPLNPKSNGFPIKDIKHPQFREVSIIPLDRYTLIDGSSLPNNYNLLQIYPNNYTIQDTIKINGKFGVSTKIVDKIQNASYAYQVNKIDMFVDSTNVFSINFNLLDFNEGKYVSTVYGQPINNRDRDDFQKLYLLDNYPKLTIHSSKNSGILDLPDGFHKIEISAHDAAGNNSILSFIVNVKSKNLNKKQESHLKLIEYPQHINKSDIFKPELFQLEKGVIFKLQSKLIDIEQVKAFIENDDALTTYPLTNVYNNTYISDLISVSSFRNSEKCGYLFFTDSISKYDFGFTPKFIVPKVEDKIYSNDSLFVILSKDTYYDTTLLWINKHSQPLNTKSYNLKSNIYEIFPHGIPYKNNLNISFNTIDNDDIYRCAIYSYNDEKSKWNYIGGVIDSSSNTVSAKIHKPAILAVLEDANPPWFLYTYPSNKQYISKISFDKIIISVDDDLSGIDSSEKYLQVFLDRQRIWVAYQPIDREISYRLPNQLSIGEHQLKINIQDRSGNSATKLIKFFIE